MQISKVRNPLLGRRNVTNKLIFSRRYRIPCAGAILLVGTLAVLTFAFLNNSRHDAAIETRRGSLSFFVEAASTQRGSSESNPNFKSKCYYRVLGVPKGAKKNDIKSAYRKLALRYVVEVFYLSILAYHFFSLQY